MLKSFKQFTTQEEWDKQTEWTINTYQENMRKQGFKDGHPTKSPKPFEQFAADLIAKRIQDYPFSFTEFGVYWFAVKDALQRHGYDFGDTMDEEMRDEYRGKTDAHTFVAAEKFKEFYQKHYFQYTTHFTLAEDDNREWVLSDPKMEARVSRI